MFTVFVDSVSFVRPTTTVCSCCVLVSCWVICPLVCWPAVLFIGQPASLIRKFCHTLRMKEKNWGGGGNSSPPQKKRRGGGVKCRSTVGQLYVGVLRLAAANGAVWQTVQRGEEQVSRDEGETLQLHQERTTGWGQVS